MDVQPSGGTKNRMILEGAPAIPMAQAHFHFHLYLLEGAAAFVTALLVALGGLSALTPDFRTTGLSGICVPEMIRKDAWKWEKNEEHSRTSSRPRWPLKRSRA